MSSNLIFQRRFAPFFWTQFLGAFNDNVFKNAVVIAIAFRGSSQGDSGWLINLAGGLFILPFVLFSQIAGQLADQGRKFRVIQITKSFEIPIMLLGSWAFWTERFYLLIPVLFLIGTQASFFGPAKYSILPELLPKEDELLQGNSWIEMSTFLGILLGTMAGGALTTQHLVATLIGLSFLGYGVSLLIPKTPIPENPAPVRFHPVAQIRQLVAVGFQNTSVFFAILGISWFWLYGATFLSQFPTFVRFTLNGNEPLVSFFLSLFTLSLALGAFICNRFAFLGLRTHLVWIGALGMTLFGWDLGFIDYSVFNGKIETWTDFFALPHPFVITRILLDIFFVGISGSIFIVPLYTLLQTHSEEKTRSQVMAANNILNSLFMVLSGGGCMVLYQEGWATPDIFSWVSFMTLPFLGFLILWSRLKPGFGKV
jgi:acyl-[acyl-carrier-protein]-phospholipid O-acyltransferase/long-chain-fatty-acid--[acyl-carrier-protein] ligase